MSQFVKIPPVARQEIQTQIANQLTDRLSWRLSQMESGVRGSFEIVEDFVTSAVKQAAMRYYRIPVERAWEHMWGKKSWLQLTVSLLYIQKSPSTAWASSSRLGIVGRRSSRQSRRFIAAVDRQRWTTSDSEQWFQRQPHVGSGFGEHYQRHYPDLTAGPRFLVSYWVARFSPSPHSPGKSIK